MDWQRVVLGIGNPGAQYEHTRHNLGFEVVDRAAGILGLRFSRLERRDADGARHFPGRVKAEVAAGRAPSGEGFLLVKPKTFVNLSGDAAGPLLRAAGLGPGSLFVIVDDLNLPLGRIRLRPAGSPGGHNGLRSIEQVLVSADYPRLRLGIGAPVGSTQVDHVLARFLPEEREVLGPVLERAAQVVVDWLHGTPLSTLMDRVNGPAERGQD